MVMAKRGRVPIFSGKGIVVCAAALPVLLLLGWYFRVDLALADPYEWHVHMGEKYWMVNDVPQAVEHIKKALAMDASRPGAHEMMAVYYSNMGLVGRMEQEVEHLRGYPEYEFQYHLLRGEVFQGQGRLAEAVEEYWKALRLGGVKYPHIYLNLGVIYMQLGNFSSAADSFREGISFMKTGASLIGPDRKYVATLHAGLGFAYEELGMRDAAEEEKSMAQGLYPSSIEDMQLAIAGNYIY